MKKKILVFALALALALTGSAVPETVQAEESCVTNTESVGAASSSVGLGVTYHTQDELVTYLNKNEINYYKKVSYDSVPSAAVPYSLGSLSEQTKKDALKLLNNVRYIAGLSSVKWDSSLETGQQAACLVGAMNGYLSHYPGKPSEMDNSTYRLGYNACRSSNLCIASGDIYNTWNLNRVILEDWVEDSDYFNISALGHRRWCLNPSMGKTAFGVVGKYYSMYAADTSNTSASQTNVAWPAQNMPLNYFSSYDAWSISIGKRVTAANVKVTLVRNRDKKTWTFSQSSADGFFNVDNSLCGQRGCIIFRPTIGSVSYKHGDTFTVTITGLDKVISYKVKFFSLKKASASRCAAGNHTSLTVNATASTTTNTGYSGDTVCARCGKTLKSGVTIPKATAIKKVTGGKRSFTVVWKKQTSLTTAYQIQYSTSRSFTSETTKSLTSKKTLTKATIKNLQAGKKYFIRIRTYKSSGGKRYYSSWSKTKAVTTK